MTEPPSEGVTEAWDYAQAPPDGTRLGIAFSGGGIRAAAFSLGALQALQRTSLIRRVSLLSAVSGGSYIAAGYISTLLKSDPASLPRNESASALDAWAPGSPEEQRLIRHLGYLARGFSGRAWLLANVLYGVTMNLLPFVAGSFLLGRLLGYVVLPSLYPDLGEGELARAPIRVFTLIAIGLVVLSALFVPLARFRKRKALDDSQTTATIDLRQATVVGCLQFAAFSLVMLFVALPASVAGVHRLLNSLNLPGDSASGDFTVIGRFLANAILIAFSLALGVMAVAVLRSGHLRWLAVTLSSLSGPLLLLTPCIMAIEGSASRPWLTHRDLPWILAAVAVLLVYGFRFHNRLYSMHHFYRERINAAFFLERRFTKAGSRGKLRAQPSPVQRAVRLSQTAPGIDCVGRPIPKLVIGASANASDTSVGYEAGGAPYVFDPSWCGSEELGWVDTETVGLPREENGSGLTLPSMVAISGAALSPVMGRLTFSSFRFLLALLNVRLGVWVRRSPSRIDGETDTKDYGWRRSLRRFDRRLGRFRVYERAKRGWLEPGPFYVLREALGITSLKGRFVYVTDGGHWENLGLYELARRRCSHIVVFDATNNAASSLADYGRACQLMFSRLGIRVVLSTGAEDIARADSSGGVPIAIGRIVYPDAPIGTLLYCKAKLWDDAPLELHLYSEIEPKFPHHSTGNQFLSADQFLAYKRLGLELGGIAAAELAKRLPAGSADERHSGPPTESGPKYTTIS